MEDDDEEENDDDNYRSMFPEYADTAMEDNEEEEGEERAPDCNNPRFGPKNFFWIIYKMALPLFILDILLAFEPFTKFSTLANAENGCLAFRTLVPRVTLSSSMSTKSQKPHSLYFLFPH